jgi:MFS family permease
MTGIGAVAGSLIVANLGGFRRKGALTLVCCIAFGLTLAAFANLKSLVVALPMLMVVGAVSTGFMAVNNTLIQMNVRDEMRGRVMSVYMMTFGLMPLGTLPAGAIAESAGAPIAITVAGGALALFGIVLALVRREMWRLE